MTWRTVSLDEVRVGPDLYAVDVEVAIASNGDWVISDLYWSPAYDEELVAPRATEAEIRDAVSTGRPLSTIETAVSLALDDLRDEAPVYRRSARAWAYP